MQDKFQAIIIDDESKARQSLHELVKVYCPEISIKHLFDSAELGLQYLLKNVVDLVFLDVRMPGMSGFDLLQHMKRSREKIVIVSAHDSHGIEAVKADAFDYLLKPVSISDLRSLVEKLYKADKEIPAYNDKSPEIETSFKISVPYQYGIKVIDFRKVVAFESDNSYCEVHFIDGSKLLVSKSLKEFELILEGKDYYRVHNKHLVNLMHLDTFSIYDGGFVTMINGQHLPVSRRRLKAFKELLQERYKRSNDV